MRGVCPFAEQIPGVTSHGGPMVPGPVGVCDHAAGGFLSTMRNPTFWNDAGTSVNFAIGRKGQIVQFLNLFTQPWGQGRDANGNSVRPNSPGIAWTPFAAMGLQNPNLYLAAVEHEDWELVNGVARAVPGSEWTPEEFDADLKLKRWMAEETNGDILRFGIDSLAGHFMFDPRNRANCPGRFWRDDYRQRLWNALQGTGDPPMQRFNTIATKLQNTGAGVVDALDWDIKPPTQSKMLRVEMYLSTGALQVKDSTGAYAGQVGWDGARYGTVDVDVSGGAFSLDGAGVLAQIGIVGWW